MLSAINMMTAWDKITIKLQAKVAFLGSISMFRIFSYLGKFDSFSNHLRKLSKLIKKLIIT